MKIGPEVVQLMQEASAVQSAMEWAAITLGLISILVQVAACVLIVAAKRRKKEEITVFPVSYGSSPNYALLFACLFPFWWFVLFRFRFFSAWVQFIYGGLLDSAPIIVLTRRTRLVYGDKIQAHRITRRIYLEA